MTTSDLDIRQARPDDAPRIGAIARQAYARYVARIGREPAPMLADFPVQIAAGAIHVAEDAEHGLLGFIVFYPEARHMLLENVAVAPQAAGRGIGRALIAFCETAARDRGPDAVHLYTNEKMTENRALYPQLGYVAVGRRTEDGFNRVYFAKALG